MDDIDKLIRCLSSDIIGLDEKNRPALALHASPERRLLALLIAYQLGDELTNKVCGDENDA